MACSQCDPNHTQQRLFAVAGPFGDRVINLPYVLNASDPYYAAIAQTGLGSVLVAVLAGVSGGTWCKLYLTLVNKEGVVDWTAIDFRKLSSDVLPERVANAMSAMWQQWMLVSDRVLCEADPQTQENIYTIDSIPTELEEFQEEFHQINITLNQDESAENPYSQVFSLSDPDSAFTYIATQTALALEVEALRLGKAKPYDRVSVTLPPPKLTPEKRESGSIIGVSPFYKSRR